MIKLTKEMIDKVFKDGMNEKEPHQADVLIRIYKIAFPNWDNIKKINSWPRISKKTWMYIMSKFIAFDKKYHPKVMNGGIWLNNGFSNNENIKDWVVDTSNCNIEY